MTVVTNYIFKIWGPGTLVYLTCDERGFKILILELSDSVY